jgi:hypothetical protein
VKRFAAGLALALCLGAHAAEPVAFVADLKGSATIEGDGKVNFLAELAAGTRLLLGTGARVAVTYASSGTEYTLVGPGEFLVTPSEVKAEKGAVPSRRAVMALSDPGIVARVSRAATASVRMRSVNPESAKALEYPVNTRVATLQPALRWRGGESTVTLTDAGGKEHWKSKASSPARLPMKLAPGTRYTWSVGGPAGSVGQATFETLSPEAQAKAERAQAAAKSFADRVLYAFQLQDLGATQDAREVWAALASERPDLPELATLSR